MWVKGVLVGRGLFTIEGISGAGLVGIFGVDISTEVHVVADNIGLLIKGRELDRVFVGESVASASSVFELMFLDALRKV